MITLNQQTKIMLYRPATDMRKSFDGLCGIVRNELQGNPTDGTLFLFINRRRDRIKTLYWDSDGLAIWYKRLESGTFEKFQTDGESQSVVIDTTQFAMLQRARGACERYAASRFAAIPRVDELAISSRS